MKSFWICGCQIASKERVLLSDTHLRIGKSAKLADYQILPESMIFWTELELLFMFNAMGFFQVKAGGGGELVTAITVFFDTFRIAV